MRIDPDHWTDTNSRSLGGLLRELSTEVSTLVRQEVRLAKMEIAEQTSELSRDITLMAIGGALMYAGFFALMFAAISLLAEVISMWLAALIIGILVVAAGGLMVQKGRSNLKQTRLVPSRTVETVKEDVEWAKRAIK